MEQQRQEDQKLMETKAKESKLSLNAIKVSAEVLEAVSEETKTGRSGEEFGTVKGLGAKNTKYLYDYDPSQLEYFENKHPGNDYVVKFNAYEFTSLCPKTGQPDFATIHIKYIPDKKMVESKSLKLYLFSFRNHGDFHEDCVNIIMKDLVNLLQPKYLEVKGLFTPRGGIAIHPFATYSNSEEKFNEIEKLRQLDELKQGFNI